MYTSEIRQTDHEGKAVSVPPDLLERVRKADEVLRDRIGSESEFEYTGRWVFPDPEKAMLSLQVKIPGEPETFTFSMSPNTLRQGAPEGFATQAIDKVLVQAGKALQARIDRRLRDLISGSEE